MNEIRLLMCLICTILAFSMPTIAQGDDFKKPTKGMTENQVRARYGDPDSVTSTGEGEYWTYTKGMGRMFIPFAGAFMRPSTMIIIFNNSGRVTTWNLQQQQ